ncbi:MAG TPA: DUF480 domain-containing protein [Pyrinomonadaceae bacterium]|jgi:uncharacterized protein YceH (UPF0502 family)|nr:DUF480 domain-containing protein [Pyrinomonadaceae bacterium]
MIELNEVEARVLGSLVEKQLTTPEYYPMTLNALTAACNQKTSRDPVVSYDEATVQAALDSLHDKYLVYLFHGSTARAVKYKHMLPSVYELEPSETAAICVLLLRGPQTPGEIHSRTGRLYDFKDLNDVQGSLDSLARRDEPMIVRLERQPGQKDARYAHLLSGPVAAETAAASRPAAVTQKDERLEKLEQEVENLRTEVSTLKETFEEFKKQFE